MFLLYVGCAVYGLLVVLLTLGPCVLYSREIDREADR